MKTEKRMAKKKIPEYLKELLQAGVISKEQILDADYAKDEEVTRALAKAHRMDYVDLTKVDIPERVIELMPEAVARENSVIPLEQTDRGLKVLMSDPEDVDTVEKLRFILNRDVTVALATRASITLEINKKYGQVEGESADSILQEFTDTAIDFTETIDDDSDSGGKEAEDSSAPIVRLVQLMITEAVQLRASDIHVEPFEDRVRIRYRIDGVLHERDSLPKRQLGAIISRIKILADIDIAEKRREQDGRIKVTTGEKELDLRVSYKQFHSLIRRPNGIILVTGPTGSGKTTTLYAAMNSLNRPDRKIITAEDPVEYYLPGINQVEVKHKIGLDFARIIRSMLRQAPNVILVGEMRDQETASMGIQASLTGHLVFSTLHTNDAPTGTICPKCRTKYKPTEQEIAEAGMPPEMVETATFMRGKGCSSCQKSGFRGRMGIYEMLMIDSNIRELIFRQASSQEIRDSAVGKGMDTLYMDGLSKVAQGYTTFSEVMRVAKRGDGDGVQ